MTKYVNNNGVSEMWLNIKNWVTSQLLGYSQTGHTHTKSQITDLDLSNYVDKTSNQTVGGQKIFTSLFSKSRNLERGTLPTTNITEDPIFISLDKNNKRILAFYNYYYTNGTGRVSLYVYNPNTTDYDNIGLMFNFDNVNNNKSIQPNITNVYSLGTTSNKWKSVYANSYYLGSTAFGNIVTHNASEFAQVGHTHSISDITDLETWNYDSNSDSIIVSGGTDTWSYDSQSNSIIVS